MINYLPPSYDPLQDQPDSPIRLKRSWSKKSKHPSGAKEDLQKQEQHVTSEVEDHARIQRNSVIHNENQFLTVSHANNNGYGQIIGSNMNISMCPT